MALRSRTRTSGRKSLGGRASVKKRRQREWSNDAGVAGVVGVANVAGVAGVAGVASVVDVVGVAGVADVVGVAGGELSLSESSQPGMEMLQKGFF